MHKTVTCVLRGESVQIDEGILPLGLAMSRVDGLRTLDSCQGGVDPASVFFNADGRDVVALAQLCDRLAAAISPLGLCCRCTINLRWHGDNPPVAEMELDPQFVGVVASKIDEVMR